MATQLVYLDDFSVMQCAAQVMTCAQNEAGHVDVQLDKTCFYPRGGGQDWDEGVIKNAGGAVFAVREVRLDETGLVHHLGEFQNGQFAVGDSVTCTVDEARRSVNTRLHSAGHVVDLAVDGLKLPLVPGRGAHYPHMSFVEYEGEIAPPQAEETRAQLQTIVDEVVQTGGHNEIRFMPVADMHTVCRHVPATIPTNKPARVVIYPGNFGVPCGGTHVANPHDIGKITITKLKTKKGLTKISYTVEGIN